MAEGVNETLKTREERKQAAEKKRQRRAFEQGAGKSRCVENTSIQVLYLIV
jgi:hypothetical protein